MSSHSRFWNCEDHPSIHQWELDRPEHLLDTRRPNLINQHVEDEWDFCNLINTDHPNLTDATTFTVGKGIVVLENGFTYRHIRTNDFDFTRRSLPEPLVRVGLTNELELRMKWNGLVALDYIDRANGLKVSKPAKL